MLHHLCRHFLFFSSHLAASPRPAMKLSGVSSTVLTLTAAFLEASPAHGISFPIVGRPRSAARQLRKRTIDMNGSYGNGSTLVVDDGDTEYSCNITLGGAEFEVLIDTGRYVDVFTFLFFFFLSSSQTIAQIYGSLALYPLQRTSRFLRRSAMLLDQHQDPSILPS